MTRTIFSFLLAVVTFCGVNGSFAIAQSDHHYQSYDNARFAYTIAYPADIFVPQGESDNGDGQRFLSKDKRAELIVYGGYAVEDKDTLQKRYRDATSTHAGEQPAWVVTYKMIKGNWFVASGRAGGRIFYQKTMLKKDPGSSLGVFKTLRIEYDESQNRDYGTIVARIVASFKG
jgi:hypothetical protein